LEEGGQGVEVAGDRAKQRSRADLGLQAFEADGDVLKLTDRLGVDAAWLVKRGGQPLSGLQSAGDGSAGDGPEALQEGSSSHVF
jgi:hypothetical protein